MKAVSDWTHTDIVTMTARELRAVVASTSPDGAFSLHRAWAQEELARRGAQ